MDIYFNPGRAVPEPDPTLMSDPFEILLESEGRDLLGRRYDFIAELLEEAFEERYSRLFANSKLHYEIINLITLCTPVMCHFGFPRRRQNSALKKAISTIIEQYLIKEEHGRNT
ncbi:MAG: hypothetical protein M3O71_21260 [Bacteroidota bacterium]|nr:hypothetical protein [Bacteroidota bacterium]